MTIKAAENDKGVALLGLGIMGSGMAQNILKAGFPLTVYNRTPEKARPLVDSGARLATSPAAAAEGAAFVISMLSDDEASKEAWLGKDGALRKMQQGSIVIECSTVRPAWITLLASQSQSRRLRILEAPVTGSRPQAMAGELRFLVGGEQDTLSAAIPVLRSMSRDILHVGTLGSAIRLKLINNFLCGVQVASFAEAFAWIERSGIEKQKALEFLNTGAPASGITRTMTERMSNPQCEVNFALRLMEKDLRYASSAAQTDGVHLTTASSAEALFRRAMGKGHGGRDMAAVIDVVR